VKETAARIKVEGSKNTVFKKENIKELQDVKKIKIWLDSGFRRNDNSRQAAGNYTLRD